MNPNNTNNDKKMNPNNTNNDSNNVNSKPFNLMDSKDLNFYYENKIMLHISNICKENHTTDELKQFLKEYRHRININNTFNFAIMHPSDGLPALPWLCGFFDNVEVLKILIDNFKDQIDINKRDKYGYTLLHRLCSTHKLDMAKLLIDNFKDQIDINVVDKKHAHTALHWVCYNMNFDMVKLIVEHFKDQIDINLRDKQYGFTALQYTCGVNVKIVKFLIDNFKDSINIMSLDNHHCAAWYVYLVFLEYKEKRFKELFLPLLLNRDKSKDPEGLTPLHIAHLQRKVNFRRLDQSRITGDTILQYLMNIPELVELDGSQRDKFQTLPHQVIPLE